MNKDPAIEYANVDAKYWVVMNFECEEYPIQVGTNAEFKASLNRYTDDASVKYLKDPSLLSQMNVRFESQKVNLIIVVEL